MKNGILGTLILAAAACGQWLNYPAPGTPRTKDGKVNLAAPAPRMGGKPDLSGVWQVEAPPPGTMQRIFGDISALTVPGDDPNLFSPYFLNILADFKPEEAPMRPEAGRLFGQRAQTLGSDNPTSHCLPMGIPAAHLLAFPYKIVQTPGLILMLIEGDNSHRQVYTDGRKLPVDPQPSWMGYSVGRWEGDTLVVETNGFNDRGWLDAFGHPRSEAMRLTEKFRRRDFGHLEVEATVDDPKFYTKPFTIKVTQQLMADGDILETVCAENERDRAHMGPK